MTSPTLCHALERRPQRLVNLHRFGEVLDELDIVAESIASITPTEIWSGASVVATARSPAAS